MGWKGRIGGQEKEKAKPKSGLYEISCPLHSAPIKSASNSFSHTSHARSRHFARHIVTLLFRSSYCVCSQIFCKLNECGVKTITWDHTPSHVIVCSLVFLGQHSRVEPDYQETIHISLFNGVDFAGCMFVHIQPPCHPTKRRARFLLPTTQTIGIWLCAHMRRKSTLLLQASQHSCAYILLSAFYHRSHVTLFLRHRIQCRSRFVLRTLFLSQSVLPLGQMRFDPSIAFHSKSKKSALLA